MKKTIAAIYTGKGLADPLQAVINRTLPDWRLISIIDDQIIGEVKEAGAPTPEIYQRLISYYKAVEAMGADVILNTCSSVGDVVYEGRKQVQVPIIRIDEAMARKAVSESSVIGVVATLRSTLDPTMRLLQIEAKKLGKTVTPVDGLADGAYQALVDGKPELHDECIAKLSWHWQKKWIVFYWHRALWRAWNRNWGRWFLSRCMPAPSFV